MRQVEDINILTERQGLQVGSPDVIAFRQGWISREDLEDRADMFQKNSYGDHLKGLLA